MQRTVDDFLRNYFSRLINHHTNIYGIHKDAYVAKIDYISRCDEILKFVDFICTLDRSVQNEFLDVFLDDIVNLLCFNTKLFEDKDRLEIIYNDFLKKCDIACDQEQFNKLLKKEFKLNQNQLKELLNTKFFYLDKYIWDKIHNSQTLTQFMKLNKLPNVSNTFDYLDAQPQSKLSITIDYSSFELDDDVKYRQEDIAKLKALTEKPDEKETKNKPDESDPLAQLIRYKKHIPYFKNMNDNEIRAIVKDVKFIRYKKNEVVIEEYNDDKDIYFLIDGGCNIILNNNELGTIASKNIFGEFSFITDKLRSATIQANQESVIISFNINLELFNQDPLLFPQLYKNIAEELVKKFYTHNVKFISMI